MVINHEIMFALFYWVEESAFDHIGSISGDNRHRRGNISVSLFKKKNTMCDLENKKVCVLQLISHLLYRRERVQHLLRC